MKFQDIVDLAKAGYKPSDIKELLELTETDPETKKKEVPEVPEKKDPEPKEEVDPFVEITKEETK